MMRTPTRRCRHTTAYTLYTSGFTDDVTFGRSGRDAETWRLHRAATAMEQRGDTGEESDEWWN